MKTGTAGLVVAVQHIRRMRGGAQGQLMLGSDGQLWVVKFQNNPQHVRVLANEMLATRLAALMGLTVPETAVLEVSAWLIRNTPEMEMELGRVRVPCSAGLQFGARYMGGLMPGQVVDYLPEAQLVETRNLEEFCGMLVVDKWTGNINGRQAVFVRQGRERRYRACFIDQGYCFRAGAWTFEDAPLLGVYPRNAVYRHVVGWESFEPWMTRLERVDESLVWRAAEEIPPEWYGVDGKVGDMAELEMLVEGLLVRRKRVRGLVEDFGKSSREPFPKWEGLGKS